VTREAYSREVISFGFWFGDDRFAEPAFYGYTAPEPAGLADQPLQPAAAWWDPRDGSHLAVLRYDDARATSDPCATVLDFYESAYQAGARLAGWDIPRLACPAVSPTRTCADIKTGSGSSHASDSNTRGPFGGFHEACQGSTTPQRRHALASRPGAVSRPTPR
jgi:hypothetical protein